MSLAAIGFFAKTYPTALVRGIAAATGDSLVLSTGNQGRV